MKRIEKFLCYFVIAAMLFQLIPVKVYAADNSTIKIASSIGETAANWYNYSIISTSTDTLELNGSGITVNGDMHTNGNFVFNGSKLNIKGICEAVGQIITNCPEKNKSIKSTLEKSAALDVPDFYENIRNTINSNAQIIDGDKTYSGKSVIISKPTIINGNAAFNTSEFNGTGYLVVDKNISFDVSTFNEDQNEKLVLCSGNGDININGSKINLNGIVYAPNGTVTFNTSSLTLKGKIIAKKIIFKGSTMNVTNDYDDIVSFVDTPDNQYDRYADSDNDGLPDFYESGILIPEMLNEGIALHNPQPDEDYDGDGLSNLQEYKLGTNPASTDTDKDGLNDYDEVYKYHTNPNLYDTDGDGMGDGTEVKNGLNPLIKDTDGDGIIDSQEVFDQVLIDSVYKNVDIQKSLVAPDIVITGSGDFSRLLQINDVSDNKTLSSIHSMVGHPFEFAHNSDLNFQSARLSFKISDKALENHELSDLKIAWYNTDNNSVNFLDTQIDDASKTISAAVNHFSYYFVIDSKDYYYDIDVLNANSKIDKGKADVVFTIDTTGSMWSSIDNVKSNIDAVVDQLKADNVDIRLGLVGFKDITCDGLYSTKDYGWFTDVDGFKAAVNALYADGGGDWEESDVDGLEVSREKDFRTSVDKYIILLTDAPFKNGTAYNPEMTMDSEISLLKSDNISVSVITDVSDSYVKDVYEPLYTQTNGIIADIYGIFVTILQPLIEKMSTVSNKGAWIRLSNGSIVHLDKDPSLRDYSIDTDKDGVPDLEELSQKLEESYISGGSATPSSYEVWTFKSNPAVADTDGDGISDRIDGHPLRFDICVENYTDDYILFNNGHKWIRFGKDIYAFYNELSNTTINMHSQTDYDNFMESDLYKDLDKLLQNRKTNWSVDELATAGILDINGLRDYLTFQDKSIVFDVFTAMTGKKPRYYKHYLTGWECKGQTPIEEKWTDFFTGEVTTDAEATLTRYEYIDLNKIITDVIFLGTVAGAIYLGVGEVSLLATSFETFGVMDTTEMFVGDFEPILQEVLEGDTGEDMALEEQVLGSEMDALEEAGTDEEAISEVREETESELELCKDGFCFTGDTLVSTSKGEIAIKDIKAGDQVYSEDPNTGEKGLKTVKRTYINQTSELTHIYAGDTEIKCTPTHRIWIENKGWTSAGKIKAGDRLRLYSGETKEVTGVRQEGLEGKINVYNLEVEGWHTYFVSNPGVWVHNEGCSLPEIEGEVQSEEVTQDLTETAAKLNNTVWRGTEIVNGETIVTDIGAFGENIAEDLLSDNGWTDFTYIKNASDNGIDIIATGPKGQLGFFEVKTSSIGVIGDLSSRQEYMDEFVQDVLTKAENGEFPYQNIDESLRNKAAEILDEYYNNPYNVSGNVIGVDLQQGEVYISRWER